MMKSKIRTAGIKSGFRPTVRAPVPHYSAAKRLDDLWKIPNGLKGSMNLATV